VLLLKFTSHRALVTEDKVDLQRAFNKRCAETVHKTTNLCPGTSKVRSKHDDPRRGIRELLARGLEAVLEEFQIPTTAVATLLVFDFILHNKGLVRERDALRKRGRNGMVGCLCFRDDALVTLNDGNGRVLDLPFADVAEGLTANRCLLRGL